MTEDLLEKVQKNELLSKRLSDPHFMQAITDFQKNPQAAITKYQSNTEVWSLLKEFSGILGKFLLLYHCIFEDITRLISFKLIYNLDIFNYRTGF